MNKHLGTDVPPLRVGAWTLFALLALPVSASTVYVAPSGNDANPGTPAAPFASLTKAVKAAGSNGEVRAAVGRYEASFVLSGGVRVRGGFRPPAWSTPSPIPVSLREAGTLPSGAVDATVLSGSSSPSVLVPAHAAGALENVIVVGPKLAASRPGTGASIAVAVGPSGDLSLDHVKVFAGDGAPGLRGTDGAAGSGICSAGGQGGTSEERHVDDTYCESHAGTAGSTVQSGGSGGAGGNAGSTKCKDNIGAGQVGSGASGSPGMVGPSGTAPDVPPVDWGAFGWPELEVHWSMGRLPASGNGGPGGGAVAVAREARSFKRGTGAMRRFSWAPPVHPAVREDAAATVRKLEAREAALSAWLRDRPAVWRTTCSSSNKAWAGSVEREATAARDPLGNRRLGGPRSLEKIRAWRTTSRPDAAAMVAAAATVASAAAAWEAMAVPPLASSSITAQTLRAQEC